MRLTLIVITALALFREAPLPRQGPLVQGERMAAADRGLPEMDRYRGRKELPAPAAVTDLTARALTDSAVVLQWTEVRSSSTAIPRYAVRYDSAGKFLWSSERDDSTTGCAYPVIGSNATGGRLHSCVVWNLSPAVAYQFQIVAYTGTLNVNAVFGPLSNIARATTMVRVGQMLLWRPIMFLDTTGIAVTAAEITDFPGIRFPLRGTFRVGSRLITGYDSSGAVAAQGYLLVTHP